MQWLYDKAANIERLLFCQTNFVRWIFVTRSEYIANSYCEQCNSQNIHSIFARYSQEDSFSVRVCRRSTCFPLRKKKHCRELFSRTVGKYSVNIRWTILLRLTSIHSIFARCSLFTCKLGLPRILYVNSLRIFCEHAANMIQDCRLNMQRISC